MAGITIVITKDEVKVWLADGSCAELSRCELLREHLEECKVWPSTLPVLFFNRLKVTRPYCRDGRGKELMRIVTQVAEDNGFAICCTPSPYVDGPLNFDQLVAFYKRYGFEEIELPEEFGVGTTGFCMMRYPKKAPHRKLSLEEKRELYRAGHYKFKCPPVHHSGWGENDWIRYIDAHGGWFPSKLQSMHGDDFTMETGVLKRPDIEVLENGDSVSPAKCKWTGCQTGRIRRDAE